MEYQAAGNRYIVDLLVSAKSLVGKAQWKWGSKSWEAPHYFDCSSLTQWLYEQIGVSIPRRVRQQFEYCCLHGKIVKLEHIESGDLLFTTSPYFQGKRVDTQKQFGHVLIVSGHNQAICSSSSELGKGVVEIGFDQLFSTRMFCGAGRILRYDTDSPNNVY